MNKIVYVQFKAAVNHEASDQQIREWIKFNVADKGEIDMSNPLWNEALRPMPGSVKVEIEEVN